MSKILGSPEVTLKINACRPTQSVALIMQRLRGSSFSRCGSAATGASSSLAPEGFAPTGAHGAGLGPVLLKDSPPPQ